MVGIITFRQIRIYLTTQLNVPDDNQADLFIDEDFDSFAAFTGCIDTDILICACTFENMVIPLRI